MKFFHPKILLVALFSLILLIITDVSITHASLTFSGANITGNSPVVIDSSSTISIGTSTATAVTIGRSGQTVNFPGSVSASSSISGQIQDTGGQVFNAQAYGWLPDDTDRSVQAQNLLNAVVSAGGGTIYFPASSGKYRADSQLLIPNNGGTPPSLLQSSIRLTGEGANKAWFGVGLGGATLDLRYNGSGGKILSLGSGNLEIDNLTLADDSTNNGTPFIYDTGTTLVIRDNTFIGSATSTQDAIVLGGVGEEYNGGINDRFGGYGTVIDSNAFIDLDRGVYLRTYANGVVISNNTWTGYYGTHAAIEADGTPDNISGIMISGNLIEMNAYNYGIILNDVVGATLIGNNFYDEATSVIANYYMTNSDENTIIIGQGYGANYVAGDAASLGSSVITGDTSTTTFPGNVGIGTSTPAFPLDVYSPNYSGLGARFTSTGGASGIRFDSTNAISTDRNWYIGSNDVAYGAFSINQSNVKGGDPLNSGTPMFYINPVGNIGIGTTAPSTTLQVAGASSTIRVGTSGLPGCIEMYDAVNSTTLEYIYPANGILIATTTKPSICQ